MRNIELPEGYGNINKVLLSGHNAFEVMLDAIDPEILNFQLFLLIPCFSPGFKNFGLAKNDDILDAL